MSTQPTQGAEPSQPASEHGGREQIIRSASQVSAAVAVSRVSGLIRETVMAHLFGAGRVFDAFSLGFRIPNLTRDLFAEGALSSAFIPVFSEYLATKDKKQAAHLANLVGTAVILIVGIISVVGVAASPLLVRWLAGAWAIADPGKFNLAVRLTQIMFPFLVLVALAAQAMGILNASDRYAVPAFASTVFNLASVGFGVSLGFWLGPHVGLEPIEGMAYGVVLGGLVQLLWQLPALRTVGIRFRPAIDWSDPGLRRIIRLMGPAIIGSAAVQVNVLVNTNFATTIVDPIRGVNGPVGWLQYAFRFMQLPLGLFGVAIAAATLPSISRSAVLGNIDQFRRTLSDSLGMVFLLTVPSAVGLTVLGNSMIAAIYQGRKFDAYDTQQTGLALACYSIGLTGYAATKVLAPAFYALGSARVPMFVSLASILINYVAAFALLRWTSLGHAGLALATSGVALFGAVVLFGVLRGQLGGIHGRHLLNSTLKIGLASLIMGVVIKACNLGFADWLGVSRIGRLVDIAISVPVGVAVFWTACRITKVPELESAARALLAPLTRAGARLRVKIEE